MIGDIIVGTLLVMAVHILVFAAAHIHDDDIYVMDDDNDEWYFVSLCEGKTSDGGLCNALVCTKAGDEPKYYCTAHQNQDEPHEESSGGDSQSEGDTDV